MKESNILGLDLALAHSCILEHNGEVTVEAPALDQFQINVRLPTAIATRVDVVPVSPIAKPVSPAISEPTTIPESPPLVTVSLPRPVSKEIETLLPPPPVNKDKEEIPILAAAEETVTIRRPKVRLDT
jgi:hypothetical protein